MPSHKYDLERKPLRQNPHNSETVQAHDIADAVNRKQTGLTVALHDPLAPACACPQERLHDLEELRIPCDIARRQLAAVTPPASPEKSEKVEQAEKKAEVKNSPLRAQYTVSVCML